MGEIDRVQQIQGPYGLGKAPVRVGYDPNRRHRHQEPEQEAPEDIVELADEEAESEKPAAAPIELPVSSSGLDVAA